MTVPHNKGREKGDVMLEPTILANGDRIERETWETLRVHFPHYELFWRLHIYPLRAKDSIHIREGVDEALQLLAMRHYSTYVNLARANEKIETKVDELRFFDEAYANLERARELATKLVNNFRSIYERCVSKTPDVNDSALRAMRERLRAYRNLIHEPLSAYVKPADGRIRIPKSEYIQKYELWTNVLYHNKPEEFEDVQDQLRNDFSALCSALEQAWKQMCQASKTLCTNTAYIKLQQEGGEPQILSVEALAASGQAFPIPINTLDLKKIRGRGK